MRLCTLGELRDLTEGLPDSTPITGSIGPEVQDALIDAGIDFDDVGEFYGSVETRQGEVRRFYVGCDMISNVIEEEDDEDEEYEDDDPDEEWN